MSFKDPAGNIRSLLHHATFLMTASPGQSYNQDSISTFIGTEEAIRIASEFVARLETSWRSHSTGGVVSTEEAAGPAVSPLIACTTEQPPCTTASALDDGADKLVSPATEQAAKSNSDVADAEGDSISLNSAPCNQEVPMAIESRPPTSAVAFPAPPSPTRAYPSLQFSLPNAREGQPYEGAPVSAPVADITVTGMHVSTEGGLVFDASKRSLVGSPVQAGDTKVIVHYRFKDEAEDAPERSAEALLTVTPDPKSLWKNIPSDHSVPFWKPDQACALINEGQRLAAASQRGRSHAHKGTCRDDDFFIGTSNGWSIAVVADGAGSAQYSRRGAQLAAQVAGEFIARALADDASIEEAANCYDGSRATEHALRSEVYKVVGYAAYEAMKALKQQAEAGGSNGLAVKLADLNTTLLIAIVRQVKNGTVVGSYSVGDGAIGVLHEQEQVTLGGTPDGGEYSGATRFLAPAYVTQDELWARTKAVVVKDFESVMLFTDGVSDPKFQSDKALEDRSAWNALHEEIALATGLPTIDDGLEARLLDWLSFWSPGEHDDRTIAIVW